MVCSASIGSAKAHQGALRDFFGHFLAARPQSPPKPDLPQADTPGSVQKPLAGKP
jgi:hypothetical protein